MAEVVKQIIVTLVEKEDGSKGHSIQIAGFNNFEAMRMLRYYEKFIWAQEAKRMEESMAKGQTPASKIITPGAKMGEA